MKCVAHLTRVVHLLSSPLCGFRVKSCKKIFTAFTLRCIHFSSLADYFDSKSPLSLVHVPLIQALGEVSPSLIRSSAHFVLQLSEEESFPLVFHRE